MTFGPCGGVRLDGTCEIDTRQCPFVDRETTSWVDEKWRPRRIEVPRVIVDHRPTGDDELDREILTTYRDLGVAILLGDHLDDPTFIDRLSTAQRATETGVATIATITGRNRNEDERLRLINGFVEAGVMAILCVTGDHPAARFAQHDHVDFRSEGTLLANEARRSGAVVAVAESPAAPPQTKRSNRLRVKQDAGADFAILNHAGSVEDILAFAALVRDDGPSLAMVAPVPVMTDRRSIDALDQLPGVELPSTDVARIVAAADPADVGVSIAVRAAQQLLDSGLFAGVNLSGIATGAGPQERGRIMGAIARWLDGHSSFR